MDIPVGCQYEMLVISVIFPVNWVALGSFVGSPFMNNASSCPVSMHILFIINVICIGSASARQSAVRLAVESGSKLADRRVKAHSVILLQ